MGKKNQGKKYHEICHYCQVCSKSFMTVGSRNDHERNVHEKLRPHTCDQCGKQFYRKFNLLLHKRKHISDDSYSCEICKKKFKSGSSVKTHMKTHTNHRPFMCEVCGKVFKTLAVLEAHNNIHTKQTNYNCRLCEKSYPYRASLFLHMRTHTGQRPYKCKDCNASFIVKSHLTDHIRIHTQERPFECNHCGASFARKISLKKHLKSHIRAGLEINIEEALLHKQSNAKDGSIIRKLHIKSDTILASRRHSFLDHPGESIILQTNLPSDEDELVTVTISRKNKEGNCSPFKEPSVSVDRCSQKVIVKNAYDKSYDIHDHDLCVSEVIRSKESSQLPLSMTAWEECATNVPDFNNVCEVRESSFDPFPSSCVMYPDKINVISPLDIGSSIFKSTASVTEDVTRIVGINAIADLPIDKVKGISNIASITDIQAVVPGFNDKQSEFDKTILQDGRIEEICTGAPNFEVTEVVRLEKKKIVNEVTVDKKNSLRKCKYCNVKYRYLACLKAHEEMHEKSGQMNSSKDAPVDDPRVLLGRVSGSKPSVLEEDHPFRCEICGAGFSFRSELRKHAKSHSLKYSYVCKKCSQAFQQEVYLVRHKCVSSDSLSFCKTNSVSILPDHLSNTDDAESEETQTFTCDKCKTIIQTPSTSAVLDSHTRTSKLCNKCQTVDVDSSLDWSYEKGLALSKNLFEIEKSKDEKTDDYALELESIKVFDEKSEREIEDKPTDNLNNVSMCDGIDGMQSVTLESLALPLDDCGLEVTIQTHNQEFTVKNISNLRRFKKRKYPEILQCKYCPMLFKYHSTLKTHERTHTGEKPFSCSLCNKTFANKSNVKLHERIHTGERSFLCDFCGKYFSYKYSLDVHKKLHTNELPFICVICGKGFRYESSRSVHMKRHTGNKAFKCDFCSKDFVSKVEMEDHRRTHTGEKPYQCDDCGRNFSYRHHLVDHLRIHTGHKPYMCHICNMSFRRLGMLKSHLQKHSSSSVNP